MRINRCALHNRKRPPAGLKDSTGHGFYDAARRAIRGVVNNQD
jgi:hypothetical protein